MIRLQLDISYPGLTPAEEERLRENLRRAVQPFVAQVCCSMQKDAVGPDWEPGDFLRSMHLQIDGDIKVVA